MGKQEKAATASTPLLPLEIERHNPASGGAEVGSNLFSNPSTRATPPFGNPLIW
ncbi:hypothetical protein PVAP13_9NG669314 [Panicum virgatum]|uniref:Uncharacterized protein n=1 Tax=Panicum virgatum TaxID=38727 RepID=A0A8T0N4F3_PANVG|nr:hypothetical protein PVAP13_9NG669314 [Panicum virgatum]